jgi:23S rRNA pseudouridine2605 synthase
VKAFRQTPSADSRPVLSELSESKDAACVAAPKTLERVLSKAGVGSRVEARRWIHAGRVTVNGTVVENPDHWIDMARDRVRFDGKPLVARERIYLLLYKPTGYLTTYRDPEKRPTVYDLTTDVGTFLSPVGRLDLDTSGLLLMTNDNAFAERVTNPDSHVPKTYLVKASMRLTDEQLDRLRHGIDLSDGPTRPAAVTRVRDSAKYTHFEITLTEGRNRQVRRMVEALGATVLKLVRVKIGDISIGALPIGKWRMLTPAEVASVTGQSDRGSPSNAPRRGPSFRPRPPRPRSRRAKPDT